METELILHQLSTKENILETTSCGRILDAVAAILGVVFERSYEGEPAIKLESIAINGKNILNQKPIVKNHVLLTTQLLLSIFNCRKQYSARDLAYSAHAYLAEGLAEIAIENALEKGIRNIGFSGGVASNKIMSDIIRKKVESENLNFIVHKQIPPGDGGLSFGQAVVGGFFRF